MGSKTGYIRPITLWFFLCWFSWVAAAFLFTINPHSSLIPVFALASLFFSAVLIFWKPLLGLYLLPLPLLIGPVYSIPIPGVGSVTIGDLYSIMLIVRVIFLRSAQIKVTLHPLLLVCSALLVISALFSININQSFVGLTKILQFALLIWTSIILVKTPLHVRNLFNAWVFVTTLCAAMVLWYLIHGQPQFLLVWASGVDDLGVYDFTRTDVLLRTSFFYTNLFIPLGLSILYALFYVFTIVEGSRFGRLLFFLSIPVNVMVLVTNNTRAMLFPVIVFGSGIIVWHFLRSIRKPKSLILYLIFALLLLIIIGVILNQVISENQLEVMQQRSADSASFQMRVSVWSSLISKTLEEPIRLLFVGWGPQSTTRSGGAEMARLLTGSLGNVEGSFDSTFIGYIVEYGLPLAAIFFASIAVLMYRTYRLWVSTNDSFALVLLVLSVSLVIAHFFQQFAISPPGLMAMQVFAFQSIVGRWT